MMQEKKTKPMHIDQQNAGPMLTTKQYEKLVKLEKQEKNHGYSNNKTNHR